MTTIAVAGSPEQQPVRVGSSTQEVWVSVRLIMVPTEYQRPYDEKWARHIADNWDLEKFDKPLLTPRVGGMYAVVKGQHRIGAVRLKFGEDAEVLCDVQAMRSLEAEAKRFLVEAIDSKRLSTGHQIKAGITAGNPVAEQLVAVIGRHGYEPYFGKQKLKDGQIRPTSLYTLVKDRGVSDERWAFVDQTVAVIRAAWGDNTEDVDATVAKAIYHFLRKWSHKNKYSAARLIDQLSRVDPTVVYRKSKAGSGGIEVAGADAVLKIYNNGLSRNKLV